MYLLKAQNIGYLKTEVIEKNNDEHLYYIYFTKYALQNIDGFVNENIIFNKPKYILSPNPNLDKNEYYLYCVHNDINFQFEIFKNFTSNHLINDLSTDLTKQINFIFALNNNDLDIYRINNKFLWFINIPQSDNQVKLNLLNNLNLEF